MNLNPKQQMIFGAILTGAFGIIFGGSLFIMFDRADIPRFATLIMFLFGAVGTVLGIAMTISGAVLMSKDKKSSPAVHTPQAFRALKQNPKEDVFRKEIEPDDEEGYKELEEHTKKFFDNIVYPQGFLEFLEQYSGGDNSLEKLKRKFPDERHGNSYYMPEVYPPDKLREINENVLLYNDDYMTQFRDILLFADDESGHCYFLLDYGKGAPKVKYLDTELDLVMLLADTFEEFAEKLTNFNEED